MCQHSPHGALQQGRMLWVTWQSPPSLLPRTGTRAGPLSNPLQAGHGGKHINQISAMLKQICDSAAILNNPAQTNLIWKIPEV